METYSFERTYKDKIVDENGKVVERKLKLHGVAKRAIGRNIEIPSPLHSEITYEVVQSNRYLYQTTQKKDLTPMTESKKNECYQKHVIHYNSGIQFDNSQDLDFNDPALKVGIVFERFFSPSLPSFSLNDSDSSDYEVEGVLKPVYYLYPIQSNSDSNYYILCRYYDLRPKGLFSGFLNTLGLHSRVGPVYTLCLEKEGKVYIVGHENGPVSSVSDAYKARLNTKYLKTVSGRIIDKSIREEEKIATEKVQKELEGRFGGCYDCPVGLTMANLANAAYYIDLNDLSQFSTRVRKILGEDTVIPFMDSDHAVVISPSQKMAVLVVTGTQVPSDLTHDKMTQFMKDIWNDACIASYSGATRIAKIEKTYKNFMRKYENTYLTFACGHSLGGHLVTEMCSRHKTLQGHVFAAPLFQTNDDKKIEVSESLKYAATLANLDADPSCLELVDKYYKGNKSVTNLTAYQFEGDPVPLATPKNVDCEVKIFKNSPTGSPHSMENFLQIPVNIKRSSKKKEERTDLPPTDTKSDSWSNKSFAKCRAYAVVSYFYNQTPDLFWTLLNKRIQDAETKKRKEIEDLERKGRPKMKSKSKSRSPSPPPPPSPPKKDDKPKCPTCKDKLESIKIDINGICDNCGIWQTPKDNENTLYACQKDLYWLCNDCYNDPIRLKLKEINMQGKTLENENKHCDYCTLETIKCGAKIGGKSVCLKCIYHGQAPLTCRKGHTMKIYNAEDGQKNKTKCDSCSVLKKTFGYQMRCECTVWCYECIFQDRGLWDNESRSSEIESKSDNQKYHDQWYKILKDDLARSSSTSCYIPRTRSPSPPPIRNYHIRPPIFIPTAPTYRPSPPPMYQPPPQPYYQPPPQPYYQPPPRPTTVGQPSPDEYLFPRSMPKRTADGDPNYWMQEARNRAYQEEKRRARNAYSYTPPSRPTNSGPNPQQMMAMQYMQMRGNYM